MMMRSIAPREASGGNVVAVLSKSMSRLMWKVKDRANGSEQVEKEGGKPNGVVVH